jgi:hypothetical protein
MNYWINDVETRQREILGHHSAIEGGLLEARKSANRVECELLELATEIVMGTS